MKFSLYDHAAYGTSGLAGVEVTLERPSESTLQLRYAVTGRISHLIIPAPAEPLRTDGLWRATCFEFFLRPSGSSAYREFNFSPSGQWAAYEFSGYRRGMHNAYLVAEPEIRTSTKADRFELLAKLSLDLPGQPHEIGLSAVVESVVGKSYWAISHPSGAPDFHHDCCFAAKLPPARAP